MAFISLVKYGFVAGKQTFVPLWELKTKSSKGFQSTKWLAILYFGINYHRQLL
jgi:hypothetical protein